MQLGEFRPVFLRLPPEKIVELKALLESYDELGVLRTLNRKTGVVVILTLSDLAETLDALLGSVTVELGLQRGTPEEFGLADSLGEDWMVTALASEG